MTPAASDLHDEDQVQSFEALQLVKLRRIRRLRRELAMSSTAGHYVDDPVGFARECIHWPEGQGLTGYQEENLTDLRTAGRLAVRGPHGLGKTTTNAVAVLWFALTREALGRDWKVITTAGAWNQLEEYLWPEIHKWSKRLRWQHLARKPFREPSELKMLALDLEFGSAFAVASDNPALIEGAHADSVLYVFDESKAIAAETFDAAEGALINVGRTDGLEAYALATSTPGEPVGRFYDIHTRKPGLTDWAVRHVTSAEVIAAGRAPADWVEKRAAQWGRKSAIFANRALGEFHTADTDTVIPLEHLEAAVERWRAWDRAGRPETPGRRIVSVDVARGGEDRTVIAIRQGDVVQQLIGYEQGDTVETSARAQTWLQWPQALGVVDDTGVGGGVTDILAAVGCAVVPFIAAGKADRLDRSGTHSFPNVRSAAWWNLRELLDPAWGSNLMLPPDDLLLGDLTTPKWREVAGSPHPRYVVEPRDDIVKRLGRSPDAGTAVVQAFWVNGAPPLSESQAPMVARWAGTESYI